MASLQDYVTTSLSPTGTGVSAKAPVAGTPIANNIGNASDLAKNIVVAWSILFVTLGVANIVIRKLGHD